MNAQQAQYDGVLLIDKPGNCTSHDVVARVRRKLNMKKVGHAGTLDPSATGLLIILVGKGTKVSQYLMSLPKEYEGSFKLGESTDSHDADGEITQTRDVPNLSREEFEAAMKDFVGDQYQTPPMFSAKKVQGVPLYKMARKGKEIEREPRFIHVSSFELGDYELPGGTFKLACSKGTYVRTIIHDLGEKLGCGAHMNALRRTRIENFTVDKAAPLEAFESMTTAEIRRRIIPVYQAVPSHVL